MLAYTPDKLIFLNSASTETRKKMRVRLSTDCGRTWKLSRWLFNDQPDWVTLLWTKGGYSSMTKTSDFHTAVLVESSPAISKRSIEFVKFNLNWLCEGTEFCNSVACKV